MFIRLSIAILCIGYGAIGRPLLGAEVQLQTRQLFRRHQKWTLIQDTEFTGWVKIKNQHGYYLVVKKDKEPAVGGIITTVFIDTAYF